MKFPLGEICWTRGVNEKIASNTPFAKYVLECLRRHASCDWGEIDDSDKQCNNEALENGGRLFSAYMHVGDRNYKVWIITEADRSVTTVLFPDEY
jgi:hypothetical protein